MKKQQASFDQLGNHIQAVLIASIAHKETKQEKTLQPTVV